MSAWRRRRSGSITSELLAETQRFESEADLPFLSTEIPQAIRQSLDGIERIARIVRAMRNMAHPDQGQKAATDINHVIESTVTVCRNEWKYVADLQLAMDPTLPRVPCLAGEFGQVILNLLINAAHAIGQKVGDGSGGKGRITIATCHRPPWAEIRVTDTGTGIPPGVRHRIFEPFFTTKPVGKGTGQGLSISRNVIVHKHGGTLGFESTEGEGTTFIIRLPVDSPPIGARGHNKRSESAVPAANGGGGTVSLEPALPAERVMEILERESQGHFDPEAYRVFMIDVDELLAVQHRFSDNCDKGG